MSDTINVDAFVAAMQQDVPVAEAYLQEAGGFSEQEAKRMVRLFRSGNRAAFDADMDRTEARAQEATEEADALMRVHTLLTRAGVADDDSRPIGDILIGLAAEGKLTSEEMVAIAAAGLSVTR